MKARRSFKKEGGPLSVNNEAGRGSRGTARHGVCRLSGLSQAWPGARGWNGERGATFSDGLSRPPPTHRCLLPSGARQSPGLSQYGVLSTFYVLER